MNGRVPSWEKNDKWESDSVSKEGLMGKCQGEKRVINRRETGWEKWDEWESAGLRKKNEWESDRLKKRNKW